MTIINFEAARERLTWTYDSHRELWEDFLDRHNVSPLKSNTPDYEILIYVKTFEQLFVWNNKETYNERVEDIIAIHEDN